MDLAESKKYILSDIPPFGFAWKLCSFTRALCGFSIHLLFTQMFRIKRFWDTFFWTEAHKEITSIANMWVDQQKIYRRAKQIKRASRADGQDNRQTGKCFTTDISSKWPKTENCSGHIINIIILGYQNSLLNQTDQVALTSR